MLIAPPEMPTTNGRLRRMERADLPAFCEMNADPRVMEFFPDVWSLEQSCAAFQTIEADFAKRGFGIYALEVGKEFAGIVGLAVPSFQSYFTPCTEILWRLFPRFWGRGLASEAGSRVLQMAFHTLRMAEVVAFTAKCNLRSIRVMQRLGMERDQREYFDHPNVADIRLRQHVLYRATPEPHSAN